MFSASTFGAVSTTLEKLDDAPIWEVVCGVAFEPIPELTPFYFGLYWSELKDEFPRTDVWPAVGEQQGIVLASVPPLRAVMFSEDETYVLQFQADRFYMNWRRVSPDSQYPRFSDRGESPGIASLLQERFEHFQNFVRDRVGRPLQAKAIELAKIDVFAEGKHWANIADLAELLPWLKNFQSFAESDPAFVLRLDEKRKGGMLAVVLASDTTPPLYPNSTRVVKLETRFKLPLTSPEHMRASFDEANDVLNEVFAKLIPPAQRAMRFRRVEPSP